jgi:hypothetical protein
VRTILSLQTFDDNAEAIYCFDAGIQLINLDLPGYWVPSDDDLRFTQRVLRRVDLCPIAVHCRHDEERTGLVIALRRIETGWPVQRAYAEMVAMGCRWPHRWFYRRILEGWKA